MSAQINKDNLGKLLQQARESRHVLQSEMVDDTGLTKNHISAVERGVSQPSVNMLLGYCKKLDMTPNEILGFETHPIDSTLQSVLSSFSPEEQKQLADLIQFIKEK